MKLVSLKQEEQLESQNAVDDSLEKPVCQIQTPGRSTSFPTAIANNRPTRFASNVGVQRRHSEENQLGAIDPIEYFVDEELNSILDRIRRGTGQGHRSLEAENNPSEEEGPVNFSSQDSPNLFPEPFSRSGEVGEEWTALTNPRELPASKYLHFILHMLSGIELDFDTLILKISNYYYS